MSPRRPATLLASLGGDLDPRTGGLVPPIQPATTFARKPDYSLIDPACLYGRDDAPIYPVVERLLAKLEGGAAALVLPSGMAALAAILRTIRRGQAIAAQRGIYYGTVDRLQSFTVRHGIGLHWFEGSDPGDLERVVTTAKPALVLIETPSNPLLEVVDIARSAEVAHAAGALLMVDSTAATPLVTRPLALGADLVMHSATKALNGHSDVLAGVLVTAREDERWAEMRADRHDAGALLGPFEAWLLLRGLRTLALRVERMNASALQVAGFLAGHPAIERVLYPGLPSHPGHEIAKLQMTGGFGYLMSFLVRGGAEEALRVAGRLEVIARATSLGGVESVIEHRASIEPASTSVPANLLRLSIGIEDPADLITDLTQPLTG